MLNFNHWFKLLARSDLKRNNKGLLAMRIKVITTGLISLLLLSGCISTPLPDPIETKQAGDSELSCEYILAEYRGNTEAARRKIDKNNDGDVKDLAIGFLIWPGLADFNNAPGHEGNALLDRNSWLKNVAIAKTCGLTDLPEQPKRY